MKEAIKYPVPFHLRSSKERRKEQRKRTLSRILFALTVAGIVTLSVLLFLLPEKVLAVDTEPPFFTGLTDRTVTRGQGIALRQGVKASDERDGDISFEVHPGTLDLNTPGTYTVRYIATDRAGNTAAETVTVTVLPEDNAEISAALRNLIDDIITENGLTALSVTQVCEFLYDDIKNRLSYVSESYKSDWMQSALNGLIAGSGDCFTYCSVARAFFERLDIPVLTVQRTVGVRSSTHFWLLVNTGSADAPAWYHFDVCPHQKEYPFRTCLVTDAELLGYNKQVEDYYTFDMEQYPRTP